jgi:N-acetylmuramoyl-L-alanine amidase
VRIMLDPGHGGKDPGAVAGDLQEKDIVLQVALLLEEELEDRGHDVEMTRRSDIFLPLERRAALANSAMVDFFISLHCNSSINRDAHGMEVFHFRRSERSRGWAQKILAAMAQRFPGHKNRGVKDAVFAVLRLTKMPAVLVELEFLSNPDAACFLDDPACQAALAEAIADAVGAVTAH